MTKEDWTMECYICGVGVSADEIGINLPEGWGFVFTVQDGWSYACPKHKEEIDA